MVSKLGCSFIINHTQIGPRIVSKRKKRLTSAAVINLGAIVISTNGIATHKIHIKGTIKISVSISSKLSTKNRANIATQSFPITAEGTRFLSLADLTTTAPIAKPVAVINPNMSPKKTIHVCRKRSLNASEHLDEWPRRRPDEIHKVLHDHVFLRPDQETSADRMELQASGGPG